MADHFVRVDLTFKAPVGATAQDFDELLDAVLDHLEDQLGREADATASLRQMTASVVITTPDRSADALLQAGTDLRAALHAAGCGTAAWPFTMEQLRMDQPDGNTLATA